MAIRAVQICVFTALALGPPQKKRFDFEVLLRPSQQSIRTAGRWNCSSILYPVHPVIPSVLASRYPVGWPRFLLALRQFMVV